MRSTEPPEIIEVDAHVETVACDGGGVLGHPIVYYTFGANDAVECGYCDRRFVRRPETGVAAGHAPAVPAIEASAVAD